MAKLLTPAQERVVRLMREGWVLLSAVDGGRWLKRDVDGRMVTEDVRRSTLDVLRRKGLVVLDRTKYPLTRWKLTPEALRDA